jgi:hypothetical protein
MLGSGKTSAAANALLKATQIGRLNAVLRDMAVICRGNSHVRFANEHGTSRYCCKDGDAHEVGRHFVHCSRCAESGAGDQPRDTAAAAAIVSRFFAELFGHMEARTPVHVLLEWVSDATERVRTLAATVEAMAMPDTKAICLDSCGKCGQNLSGGSGGDDSGGDDSGGGDGSGPVAKAAAGPDTTVTSSNPGAPPTAPSPGLGFLKKKVMILGKAFSEVVNASVKHEDVS